MNGFDLRDGPPATSSGVAGTGIAPGKRSLTQSLPPVQRSLRDEQRAVADFDHGVDDNFYDARSTVEGRPTQVLLTDQQLRTAQRRNPHWIRKLRLSAPPDNVNTHLRASNGQRRQVSITAARSRSRCVSRGASSASNTTGSERDSRRQLARSRTTRSPG